MGTCSKFPSDLHSVLSSHPSFVSHGFVLSIYQSIHPILQTPFDDRQLAAQLFESFPKAAQRFAEETARKAAERKAAKAWVLWCRHGLSEQIIGAGLPA